MKTNKEVIQAWKEGKCAYAKHLTTDGLELWSCNLSIGFKYKGIRFVKRYQSPNFISQATSCHVGLALQYAQIVLNPHEDMSPEKLDVLVSQYYLTHKQEDFKELSNTKVIPLKESFSFLTWVES